MLSSVAVVSLRRCVQAMLAVVFSVASAAVAADDADPIWSFHVQSTVVEQYHDAFHSDYTGANSLYPRSNAEKTFDLTLFAGMRLWSGAEVFVNPEVDQGFGLSDTLGVAGFPSGEAYKVGKSYPYVRWQRLFFRQTIDLGGDSETVGDAPNQVAGTRTRNNLVITAGKFSVTDLFDTNVYAHDPRGDFLNWSLIDSGAFDYAADAWGYSIGVAAEWTVGDWTWRNGLFNLSKVPNSTELETNFDQREFVSELEYRYELGGRGGKLKVLGFVNRGRMGSYDDAIALADATGSVPDTALVRKTASRAGGAVNIEQVLTDTVGMFARFSCNDGSKEAFEFTEINRSAALGLSIKGNGWSRPDDNIGVAVVVNALSSPARAYFADGGLGILIGDGGLRYGSETIAEAYYNAALTSWLALSIDYQYIDHPAYNRDRGPVSVIGGRLHVAF
jgi:high affinity Mn2+ porin